MRFLNNIFLEAHPTTIFSEDAKVSDGFWGSTKISGVKLLALWSATRNLVA